MGLAQGGDKIFKPTPPDKGSFPLDHEGDCTQMMTAFLDCLKTNKSNGRECRAEQKAYLQCRMDNELMAKESWSALGFKPEEGLTNQETPKQ